MKNDRLGTDWREKSSIRARHPGSGAVIPVVQHGDAKKDGRRFRWRIIAYRLSHSISCPSGARAVAGGVNKPPAGQLFKPFAGAAVPVPGRGSCPQGFVASGKLVPQSSCATSALAGRASPEDSQQASALGDEAMILVRHVNIVGD